MSPTLGRFINIDPLEYIDGMNLYEYVASNPIMNIDPYGLALYAFDGTGNNKDVDPNPTNIGRLWDSYTKRKHYYHGVGTYGNEPGGNAFGQGGRRILEEAYAQKG